MILTTAGWGAMSLIGSAVLVKRLWTLRRAPMPELSMNSTSLMSMFACPISFPVLYSSSMALNFSQFVASNRFVEILISRPVSFWVNKNIICRGLCD